MRLHHYRTQRGARHAARMIGGAKKNATNVTPTPENGMREHQREQARRRRILPALSATLLNGSGDTLTSARVDALAG